MGRVGPLPKPVGAEEKQVNFAASASVLAFAADSADSSYYIGDEPKEGEYRIQRFVEGKEEASISFTPPEPKKAHGAEGETAVGLQIAVDPGTTGCMRSSSTSGAARAKKKKKNWKRKKQRLEKEGKQCNST